MLQTLQQQIQTANDDPVAQVLKTASCQELYACLQTDLWPAICTTLDNSAPEDKAKAIILLDAVMTRLLLDTEPEEVPKDWFSVEFAKEILLKVIAKV